MTELTTRDALHDAIERSGQEPIVIYKHSSTCGLSDSAQRRIADLTPPDDPDVYRIIVQDHRGLSNEVEERFDIRHETPQVIVLDDRRPILSVSHRDVSAQAVREAVNNP